jgi:hypothetical protein
VCARKPKGLSRIANILNQVVKWVEGEFEDTKGATRIHISKKNRQLNGQKKKYKRTNNDLQNIHINLKIEEHEPH